MDDLGVTCCALAAEAGPCMAEESSWDSFSSAIGIPNGLQGIPQGAESLPHCVPSVFHPTLYRYGRDGAVCYRDNFHPTLVLDFVPPLSRNSPRGAYAQSPNTSLLNQVPFQQNHR